MAKEQDQSGKPDLGATFMRGATNGAINGALMLGIFNALYFGASLLIIVFHTPLVLATYAIGVAATTIFGGVASMRKENNEYKADVKAGRAHARSQEVSSPVIVPVLADKATGVDATGEAQSSTQWRDKFSSSRSGGIEALLARGSAGGGSHVDALQNQSRDGSRAASLG